MRLGLLETGAALLLAGCLQAGEPATPACASCHGSAESAAPPQALGGITDPSHPGVGAHTAHRQAEGAVPVPCAECHTVPDSLEAVGHIDSPWPAEVKWGALSAPGAEPFHHATLTCTVYCHGATLAGATNPTPSWTGGPAEIGCDSCHGNPPPAPHPAATDSCSDCHSRPGDTAHVDGVLQVDCDTLGCTDCHGSKDGPAPTGGAHEAHVTGGDFSAPVACETCHTVPTGVCEPGHLEDAPDDVLGAAGFDGAACTNTCHSGSGATVPSPSWTTVDGTQDACGACHGLPPPPGHPANPACEGCHAPTAGPGQTIASPATHVDGSLDL